LNSSSDRVQEDGEIQGFWVPPFVDNFIDDVLAVLIIEFHDSIDMRRSLSNQCAFDKQGLYVLEIILGREFVNVAEEF
jgi:hypothetical protein